MARPRIFLLFCVSRIAMFRYTYGISGCTDRCRKPHSGVLYYIIGEIHPTLLRKYTNILSQCQFTYNLQPHNPTTVSTSLDAKSHLDSQNFVSLPSQCNGIRKRKLRIEDSRKANAALVDK